MTPTAFSLDILFPWDTGASELWARALLQAQESFGTSVSAALIEHYSDPPSSADWPTCSLYELGLRFPRLRHLFLCNVVLQTGPRDDPQPLSVFAQLDTLSIEPWRVDLDRVFCFTTALFLAFMHMPQLRVLEVHAPARPPFIDPTGNPTGLPTPPFTLESLSYSGAIPHFACALIISCSRRTLSELRVRLPNDAADEDEAQLFAAIAQAAPRLRVLHLSAQIGTHLEVRLGPVFARLARLRTLRLGLGRRVNHTQLSATIDLLARAPSGIPLRTLRLDQVYFTLDAQETVIQLAKQLVDMPQTRRLTCVVLSGFYIGYRNRIDELDLMEHWRSRRICYKLLGQAPRSCNLQPLPACNLRTIAGGRRCVLEHRPCYPLEVACLHAEHKRDTLSDP